MVKLKDCIEKIFIVSDGKYTLEIETSEDTVSFLLEIKDGKVVSDILDIDIIEWNNVHLHRENV